MPSMSPSSPTGSPTHSPTSSPTYRLISYGNTYLASTVGQNLILMPECGTTNGAGGAIRYSFIGQAGCTTVIDTCQTATNFDNKLRVYRSDNGTCVGVDDGLCGYANGGASPGQTVLVLASKLVLNTIYLSSKLLQCIFFFFFSFHSQPTLTFFYAGLDHQRTAQHLARLDHQRTAQHLAQTLRRTDQPRTLERWPPNTKQRLIQVLLRIY